MNKNLVTDNYINFLPIFSYSRGIFYFVNTVRNIGKSWQLAYIAWRRAEQLGKKTILIRRFKNEAKEAAESLYASTDLIKYCKTLIPYDETTKKGNFKRRGSTFYIKRNKKWVWFLKITNLAKFKNFRSAGDIDCDRIFFDEYTTTLKQYRLYKGNEVEEFIDMFISICREHPVKAIFCGNKESFYNPYFDYFHIPALPSNFEGLRQYRKGTVIVYQRNRGVKSQKQNQFLQALNTALKGTAYGDYMQNAAYKQSIKLNFTPPPKDVENYTQIKWRGKFIRFTQKDGIIYVDDKRQDQFFYMCDETDNTTPYQLQLIKSKDKPNFYKLIQAVADNRIKYSSEAIFNAVKPFFTWLGITN